MRAWLLASALLVLPMPSYGVDPIGSVEIVTGEAYGTPPRANRRQLALSDALVQDEFIETKSQAGVSIRFADGTSFHLGSDSSAKLDRFLYDPSAASADGVVQLGEGVFRFISGAGQSHEDLTIQTPNSVIGIRGTDFIVVVNLAIGTQLGTLSGLVLAKSLQSGQEIAIEPGRLGSIDTNGVVAVEDSPVPEDEFACWLAQDIYVCQVAEGGAGAAAAPAEKSDVLGGDDKGGPAAPAGPGPGPDPDPGDPGGDPGDDPGNDPGSDPGEGDPGSDGGTGDPGDGDPGGDAGDGD